jgi:hypothetical protein
MSRGKNIDTWSYKAQGEREEYNADKPSGETVDFKPNSPLALQ